MKTILIAGGTGFLGKNLAQHFLKKGHKIIILTRKESKLKNGIIYENWDAKRHGSWIKWIDEADVVINLTGKSVDCRYTNKNKKLIMSSRIDSTRAIGKVIENSATPPLLWINASTATIYRHSEDKIMTEANGEMGDDFSISIAKNWENEFYKFDTKQTRKVALRTSLVLGKNGGVYPVLSNLVRFYLGGKQGDGNQKFAWLHLQDFLRIVDFTIENKNINGSINTTAPSNIDNARFMKSLRNSLAYNFGLPQPKWFLKIGAFMIRTEPELILKSRWVSPKILLDHNFNFLFTDIDLALEDLSN